MRMVRKYGSYDEFVSMRQWVLDNCAHALINDIYDKKNGVIYLYFWDSDYIPQDWHKYVVRPIATMSEETGVSEVYSKQKPDDPHPLP